MSIHFVLCVLSSFKRQLIPTERIVHHQRQQKTEGNKPRMKHTTKKRTKPSNTSAPTAAVSAAMWPTSSITNNISNGQCDCVKKAVFLRCCCQLNADEWNETKMNLHLLQPLLLWLLLMLSSSSILWVPSENRLRLWNGIRLGWYPAACEFFPSFHIHPGNWTYEYQKVEAMKQYESGKLSFYKALILVIIPDTEANNGLYESFQFPKVRSYKITMLIVQLCSVCTSLHEKIK